MALVTEKLTVEIVLSDVAARAGVTVQTILRHFSSRDGLFDAAVEFVSREVAAEREAPVGDVREAVRVIVEHYEARGDWVVSILGQEAYDARVRTVTDIGRAVHREWVERVFAPQLAVAVGRSDLAALLTVVTDVYVWKLLRRDQSLDRDQTEQRMRDLIEAILASSGRSS
jgi:AcrR family transcriptional regulator